MRLLLTLLLCAFVIQAHAQDITSGLIAHFPLNGNSIDQVNTGYTGTLEGCVSYGVGRDGAANGAAVFDGVDDHVQLNNPGLLNLGENFTISAWIRLEDFVNTDMRIFSTLDVEIGSVTKGYAFGVNSTTNSDRNMNSLSLTLGNIFWQWDLWTSPTNSIQTGVWQHVVVTVEGTSTSSTNVKFYIDAVSNFAEFWASTENETNWATDVNAMRIGDAFTPGYPSYYNSITNFKGSIQDIRIYNRALTSADVAELYNPTIAATEAEADAGSGMYVDIYDDVMYVPGKVGIGNRTPDAELAVSGKIHAERVKVDLTVPGPDYVFEPDYNLLSLEEINRYVKEHKHLPEVPSAKEMEKSGIQLGEMSMLLLKKVEELTLHQITLLERLQQLEKQNLELQQALQKLKTKSDN